MKRWIALWGLTILVCCCLCASADDSGSASVPGDANQDGIVDGRDALRLCRYLAGMSVDIGLTSADVNADGHVDGRDLLRLARYLAGDDVVLETPKPQYQNRSLGVAYRSQDEIRVFVKAHPAQTNFGFHFRREATGGAAGEKYAPALLTEETLQNALNMLNQVRFIAGLNANVINAPEWEEKTSAISLICALNGKTEHNPARPAVLADAVYDELFKLAQEGGKSSNLYPGQTDLASSVLGYVYDPGNFSTVGHRRWVLNPSMGKTTFGAFYDPRIANGYYSAMYAFDRSGGGSQAPVAWPSQQTPLSHFISATSQPWSVSFDRKMDIVQLQVTVTRNKDGKTWRFSQDHADGIFYVNNERYGQTGCVIFRPDNLGSIGAGDTFTVEIIDHEHEECLRYTVTFFNL